MLTLVYVALFSALHAAALPLSQRRQLDSLLAQGPAVLNRLQPATLPFVTTTNRAGSKNLVEMDQTRAKALRDRAETGGSSGVTGSLFDATATMCNGVSYVVAVEIGNPFTTYYLIADTGSSNTWVGAGQPFKMTSSTELTTDAVTVQYGSGMFSGYEVMDNVTLAAGLTIGHQSIGVAVESQGFNGVDGILGLGPQGLTRGTLIPSVNKTIPTVLDNAWEEELIDSNKLGIFFSPSGSSANSRNGELTFGGTDKTKYHGSINYVPMTTTSPANMFVGIDQSVTYGNMTILETTAGIVDTGTTLILLATNAFNLYQAATGAVLDDNTGLLRVTRAQYEQMNSLFFNIGGVMWELTPNAQLWPRALNEDLGGDKDAYYLVVSDSGDESGSGLDFIDGMAFLQRFYAVYDVGQNRVGFANTQYTYAESN